MNTALINIEELATVPFLILFSLVFRKVLLIAGQQWISTFAHTATLCTLPVITYVITSVISGNIALSLGMVGALSIIRFRNPVKSPFELVSYFTMITMGIAASVSLKWLTLLGVSICGIILCLFAFDWLAKQYFNRQIFRTSFTEGNELATLEVVSDEQIDGLTRHPNAIASSSSADGFRYVFASQFRKDLIDLQERLQKSAGVQSTNLTF